MTFIPTTPPAEKRIIDSSTAPSDSQQIFGFIRQAGSTSTPLTESIKPSQVTAQSSLAAEGNQKNEQVPASVRWLMDDIESLVLNRTRLLFHTSFPLREERRLGAISELKRIASPDLLLQVAVDEFRKYGNEDRLDFASSLLLEFPKESVLTAIASMCERDVPELTSFLGVIDYLDAPSSYRSRVFSRLLQSRNPEVLEAASMRLEQGV